ncbi:MAG: hypothetical protein IIA45_13325 [Bacteroidetes bacterium]|nr:hypothetical protein [Bacteroidota bacterium]
MWDKPRQLTVYEGNGYECAHGGNAHICTAEDALSGWQSSAPHNDVIINKGIWKTNKWNAIGIGIYEGYATIWFGNDVDPAGEPRVCK